MLDGLVLDLREALHGGLEALGVWKVCHCELHMKSSALRHAATHHPALPTDLQIDPEPRAFDESKHATDSCVVRLMLTLRRRPLVGRKTCCQLM